MASDAKKLSYWEQHFIHWKSSGLSQRAYCASAGLSLATFDYWRRQTRANAGKRHNVAYLDSGTRHPAIELRHPQESRRMGNQAAVFYANRFSRSPQTTPMTPQPEFVWICIEAVDMRLGIDGLSLRIQQTLGKTPCDGSAYAFRNRRGNRIKLLVWDGSGVWLCQRRLHQGRFVWPRADDPVLRLAHTDWQWLITGVDWQRLSAPAPAHWRV